MYRNDQVFLARTVGHSWYLLPLAAVLLAGLLLGCTTAASPKAEMVPMTFSEAQAPRAMGAYHNWPLPPLEAEGRALAAIEAGDYRVDTMKETARGTSGAYKVDLLLTGEGLPASFKWKLVPRATMDNFNNSPRREIAAYQMQRLFLDPEDYVVPTSFLYCVPLDAYFTDQKPVATNIQGGDCLLGNLSLWLEEVTVPEVFYDPARFASDPEYAYTVANLNLLTYLIAHRDARQGNFLLSKAAAQPNAFSVDNGESFGSWPYNFFVENWDEIRVAGLRRDSIERLRKLERKDLDFLLVVAELEAGPEGRFRNVTPGPVLNPGLGVRRDGNRVQFGLTRSEVDDVWDRITDLLSRADRETLALF